MALHPKRKGTPPKWSIPAAEVVANMLRDGLITDAKVTNMSATKLTAGNLAVQILLTVGGSVATAASGARVDVTPTGIKIYDSDGTQRGLISNDGSGWLGASGSFSWTTAGVVSVSGATVDSLAASKITAGSLSVQVLLGTGASLATAASGARVDIVPTGIKVYDSGGTQRGQILNDGSGWFGSSSDFSWTTAGAVSINGAKIQDLTVGTLQVANTNITNAKLAATYVAGDVLLHSNDTSTSTTSTTYVKAKEIYLPFAGVLRMKFDLNNTGDGTTIGRIYKNGSAVGTERTNSGGWVTYSEDISGWSIGDLAQVYVKATGSTPAGDTRNFRLYVDQSSMIVPLNTKETI